MLGATCAELEGTKLNGLEMEIVAKNHCLKSQGINIWSNMGTLQLWSCYLCGLKRIPGPTAAEQFGEKVTRHQFEWSTSLCLGDGRKKYDRYGCIKTGIEYSLPKTCFRWHLKVTRKFKFSWISFRFHSDFFQQVKKKDPNTYVERPWIFLQVWGY